MVRMCSPVWRSRVGWAATSSWGSSTSSSSPGWWARPAVLYSMVLALWRWENSYYNFSELIFCVKIICSPHLSSVTDPGLFVWVRFGLFFWVRIRIGKNFASGLGQIRYPNQKVQIRQILYRYCYQYYFLRKLKQIIEWIRIVVLEKLLSIISNWGQFCSVILFLQCCESGMIYYGSGSSCDF